MFSAKRYLKIKVKRRVKSFISKFHLHKIDSEPIRMALDDILLFMVVRNEVRRIPYVLEYYFSRGINRAFVVDDNSTDGTAAFLLSQKKVYLFRTKQDFNNKTFWLDALLRCYGIGHWCVVVDADELLAYPHWERRTLREVCAYMEKGGYSAFDCLLLDMYSDKPLRSTLYARGANFLSAAPYFDSGSYYPESLKVPRHHLIKPEPEVINSRVYSSMRKRVFGLDKVCISKFPLVKFNPHIFLSRGVHFIEGAAIADIRGALFHFKYFDDFKTRVDEAVQREVYSRGAYEYKEYAKKLEKNPDLCLHYSGSVKFINSEQLVKLGIMKSSPKLDNFY